MGNSKLDKVYTASGDAEMRQAYDNWAAEYDRDVVSQGYITPTRVAEALASFVSPGGQPVMDYGCGTGLSGIALKQAGFEQIDGVDLSEKMLDVARERDIYRNLHVVEPEESLSDGLGKYEAIAAAGVISKGAAPPSLYTEMLHAMQPKAKLAFSLNDLSLADPEYADIVKDSKDAGLVDVLFEEHGPHLAEYGHNSGSTVYVVERLG
ncbi:class I SAM-dependent DNA methyltransferase [Aurantiacibacter gilvus]|uniref:Methyltransferase domain-containing protein n=1 Tax=Aurantiacibacter gilvus TaxID=3139141 RepID=A0ABU9IDC4_9SPHN